MSDTPQKSRVDRLQSIMQREGVDAVLLATGADLPYFTGYEAVESERLTMLVVGRSGDPNLFIPTLEVPRVEPGRFEIRPWEETIDPIRLVSQMLAGATRVAVGDHTRSAFLMALQAEVPGLDWVPASKLTSELRVVKDESEMAALRGAAEAVDRVVARIPDELTFQGHTELDVSREIAAMVVSEGHRSCDFAVVAAGPNGASPHHEPGGRTIESGDLVVIDFGGRFDGYYSDTTRTFSVGEPRPLQVEVHQVVDAASAAAREIVAPGVTCAEIDQTARRVITDSGFGEFFIHRTGHGIGREVHEPPYIVAGNNVPLRPGMTFSIEPGVYLPGQFGVRIEDIVACGEGGVSPLNSSERSLVVVS